MAEVKIISAKRAGNLDTSTAVTISTSDYVDVKGVDTSKLLFQFAQTAGAQKIAFTVYADGPYTGAGTDNLVVTSTGSKAYVLAGVETFRFKTTADRIAFGKRNSTKSSAGTTAVGTVKAYLLP